MDSQRCNSIISSMANAGSLTSELVFCDRSMRSPPLRMVPDAVILPDVQDPSLPSYRRHHHAYATKAYKGRWRVEQIIVGFEFPEMKIAPAPLEYSQDHSSRMINGEKSREHRMPGFLCCAGDQETFEAWVEQQKQERDIDDGVAA